MCLLTLSVLRATELSLGWSLGRRFSVLGRLRDCETRVVETVEDLSFRRTLPVGRALVPVRVSGPGLETGERWTWT